MEPKMVLLKNAVCVCPATDKTYTGDLYFEGGLIVPKPARLPDGCEVIDATGLTAVPSFIDIHVHFREPGREEAETIATGCRAAARGGFSRVVTMPNTTPPMDSPELLEWSVRESVKAGCAEVLPAACITRGREGCEVADLGALVQAGAVAFTDDGSTVTDRCTMKAAMLRAAELNRPVMDHAQSREAEKTGVMHRGAVSAKKGLPGIPDTAETDVVRRDIELAEETGCHLHIQHITAGASLLLLAEAKERGIRITTELTPHHLVLCDEDIPGEDANFKMNPPLRSRADKEQLTAGIVSGVIDCFATDHAPHSHEQKQRGFREAPFGVVGLETAIGATYTALVKSGQMTLLDWVKKWTTAPADIIQTERPSLQPGAPAHIALLNLRDEWQVDPAQFASRSTNSCFAGRRFTGRSVATFYRGINVWKEKS